jgi:hypothetical protein
MLIEEERRRGFIASTPPFEAVVPSYQISTTLATDGLSALDTVAAVVEELGWMIEEVGPGFVRIRVAHGQRIFSGRMVVSIARVPEGCTVDVNGKNSGGGPFRSRELQRWVRSFVETLEASSARRSLAASATEGSQPLGRENPSLSANVHDVEFAAAVRDDGTLDQEILGELRERYARAPSPVVPPPIVTPGDIAWLRERGDEDSRQLADLMESRLEATQQRFPRTYARMRQTEAARVARQRAEDAPEN